MAKKRVRAVLLLVGGIAKQGITEPDRIVPASKGALPAGVSVYTFGYGSDYNFNLLREVSQASPGKGRCYSVDSVDRVAGAFADCLSGMLSVTA